MDVLSPQLIWIENRCYRVNNQKAVEAENPPQREEYIEDNMYDEDENENEDESLEIETLPDGRTFRATLSVPVSFYSRIIGQKGLTKMKIEKKTGASIFVPRMGTLGDILVSSSIKKNVAKAARRINLICIEARKNVDCSHFCSISFANQEIKSNFEKFKNEILADPQNEDVNSIFINPNRLHLSMAVFPLLDEKERNKAILLFQDCKKLILAPLLEEINGELKLDLIGVDCMDEDHSKAHVLFAQVQNKNLQEMANRFSEVFAKEGFHPRTHRDVVKLHVTLMNTRYRPKTAENMGKKYHKRVPFDATKIVETYKNFNFGSVIVSEIHLSEMQTESCDGYYGSLSVLKF